MLERNKFGSWLKGVSAFAIGRGSILLKHSVICGALYTILTVNAIASICAQNKGKQSLKFACIDRTVGVSDMKQVPFFLAGKKLYEIGFINGSFPVQGNETEERGIWAHPIKLLNGFSFVLSENNQYTWELADATDFEHDFYSARFSFSQHHLSVTREDFVAENDKALFVKLKINNDLPADRILKLEFFGMVDIRPSWRSETFQDKKDSIYYKGGQIYAYDSSGFLTMGSSVTPSAHIIRQDTAALIYELCLPGESSVEIPFLITGECCTISESVTSLQERYDRLINCYSSEKEKKQQEYLQFINEGVRLDCSRKDIVDAFLCAKANILMNIKDERPFYPDLFLGAGVPVYPRLFGTDFCFSVAGCLSGGFKDISKWTLKNLLYYTERNLRGPHEISSDGILLGWDHIQVSLQLVDAVWEYFSWTQDSVFLKEVYPLCRRMIQDIIKDIDTEKGLYIPGHGLMEEAEFQSNWVELTTAAYTFPALDCMAKMASIMGEVTEYGFYSSLSSAYKKRFNADWWDNSHAIWPSALSGNGEKVYSHFWNVVFPQKTHLAQDQNGQTAFESIHKYWVNDSWGMVGKYNEGEDISHNGVGLVHNNICATAAFEYGHTDLGWKLIQLSSQAPLSLQDSPLGLFPECQPRGCSNISQLWSYATFVESIVKGLAGIQPGDSGSPVEIYLHIPNDLDYLMIEGIKIGNDYFSVSWRKMTNKELHIQINGGAANKQKEVKVRIDSSLPYKILLNKKKKKRWEKEVLHGIDTETKVLHLCFL